MTIVQRDRVKEAVKSPNGATLIEVLDPNEYEEFHLPGAINIPLDKSFDERVRGVLPEKSIDVIVYCKNRDCKTSSMAATRMESLGYTNVMDYRDGKMDWKEAGLPIEN